MGPPPDRGRMTARESYLLTQAALGNEWPDEQFEILYADEALTEARMDCVIAVMHGDYDGPIIFTERLLNLITRSVKEC